MTETIVLVTWGFDRYTGEKYLDCFYVMPPKFYKKASEILMLSTFKDKEKLDKLSEDIQEVGRIIEMMRVRNSVQQTHLKIFKVELPYESVTRDIFEDYIKVTPVQELLKNRTN